MKLIYKPFGIVIGIGAGLLSRRVFNAVWEKLDDEDPPKATTEEARWGKVLGAAALQGAVAGIVRTAVRRSGAKGFARLTGVWPGERRPDAD